MRKRQMRIPRIVFVLLLALGLCAQSFPVLAVTQAEIDALEARRDELQTSQNNLREQLDTLQGDRESVLARKAALDEQSELLRQDIVLLNEQIDLYEELIAEKQEETARARAEETEQFERYRQRVRLMEERNTMSYISFILRAESLTDLLARVNDVTDILSHSQHLRDEYVAARERAEEVEAEYVAVQAEQEAKRTELLAQEAQLAEQVELAGKLIEQLEDDIEFYEGFYASVEAEKEAILAEIDEKAAELKKQQEEAERLAHLTPTATGVVSTGYYTWPATSTWITSPFGMRESPIAGASSGHSGVDIGASYGTPITAAAAGTVSVAVENYGTTGYGTYVAIYHPNGTTTLYGHMSALCVSVGEAVSQGQVIGYVGSTGVSTGPHLHFEVRINGACVDPLQYFSF